MELLSSEQLLECLSEMTWTICAPSPTDILQSFLDHWPGYSLEFGPEFPALSKQQTVYFLILKTLNAKAQSNLGIDSVAKLKSKSTQIYRLVLREERPFEGDVVTWITLKAYALKKSGYEVQHRHGRWLEISFGTDLEVFQGADSRVDNETQISILALESALDERQFKAMVLHHVFGLTDSETAKRLEVSVTTARNWIRRGIEQGRRILEEQE